MKERITEIVESLFSTPEYQTCFLIEVNHKNEMYEVVMDDDDGVTLDLCKTVSRHVESFLDQEYPEAQYRLDVSSPGLDRPLKPGRQFQKNLGRDISVQLTDNSKVEGKLTEADEHGFSLLIIEKVKEGNKKVTRERTQRFAYDEIKQVKILIKF